ncbi:hypothetical protein QFC22_003380 [Naganishia vaughanmartiniae]|uniref:Uncharacterized protein n=1 Tax=Naganishia vaughanmartiniae TaxID=1424756 RepID=A0ACC2X8G1_9TREE|nr:hypothetical protein QFC22_003380 [Naganishia vaughanmartiniae]
MGPHTAPVSQQSNKNKISFEALLSAVVQDALSSGVLQGTNVAPASSLLPMPQPAAVQHTPGSVNPLHQTHGRSSMTQTQRLHNQHQRQQEAQGTLQRGHQPSQAQFLQPDLAALSFSPSSEIAIAEFGHATGSHLGLSVGDATTSLPADKMVFDTDAKASPSTNGQIPGMSSLLANEAACIVAGIDPSDPYASDTAVSSTIETAAESLQQTHMSRIPPLESKRPSENLFTNTAHFGFAGNANQDMQILAAQMAGQDTLQSILGLAGLDGSQTGPMACLWDDCPPFDPFAHFGQQCLDDACGLPPTEGNVGVDVGGLNAGTAIDATMLTCNPACTEQHTHLFPCEPSCSQEHAHIHPMHLHSYAQNHASAAHNVQLDSATAVLKHLLQQHLGVDLTQGLLNVASQQLGDKSLQTMTSDSRVPHERQEPEIVCTTVGTLNPPQQPANNRNHRGVSKNCKTPRILPRRLSDNMPPEQQSHMCRWHNCSEVFESVEDLTEHLSQHIGKGKADYQCLWEGCQVCDEGESRDPGQPAKGRVFTTRQKIMRHMQAHTGYRPFVCPICGTAVSEQATLIAHIRRHSEDHTGEKPFKCKHPGCSKKFSRPDQLKRHTLIHDRDKISGSAVGMATSDTEEST